MNLDEYRAVVRTVPCPLCQAGPSFHCSDHDLMSEPEYQPVDYVHDDRSLAFQERLLGALGVGSAAWPEIERRMHPPSDNPVPLGAMTQARQRGPKRG